MLHRSINEAIKQHRETQSTVFEKRKKNNKIKKEKSKKDSLRSPSENNKLLALRNALAFGKFSLKKYRWLSDGSEFKPQRKKQAHEAVEN
ncbi:CLUMA_CG007577, isoform A [Clunio marinus]|uniref:CLUMA_CG007577, isoform A n=1 Tax=Clunio marinus TaxID=568069 RepID=A0A1J1I197_9DIPT|nr:CLUMA_CG007577, isoform A [Clunio marinus]